MTDLDDEDVDRVFRLYSNNDWDTRKISGLAPLLRYFRLCRDCIAHRSSRASRALAELSVDDGLVNSLATMQENPHRGLQKFEANCEIRIAPTLAIMCSHVLRLIALDANEKLVETLGLSGILRVIANQAIRRNDELGGSPLRPEAIINELLTHARVRVGDRGASVREMKRLGIWDSYIKAIK